MPESFFIPNPPIGEQRQPERNSFFDMLTDIAASKAGLSGSREAYRKRQQEQSQADALSQAIDPNNQNLRNMPISDLSSMYKKIIEAGQVGKELSSIPGQQEQLQGDTNISKGSAALQALTSRIRGGQAGTEVSPVIPTGQDDETSTFMRGAEMAMAPGEQQDRVRGSQVGLLKTLGSLAGKGQISQTDVGNIIQSVMSGKTPSLAEPKKAVKFDELPASDFMLSQLKEEMSPKDYNLLVKSGIPTKEEIFKLSSAKMLKSEKLTAPMDEDTREYMCEYNGYGGDRFDACPLAPGSSISDMSELKNWTVRPDVGFSIKTTTNEDGTSETTVSMGGDAKAGKIANMSNWRKIVSDSRRTLESAETLRSMINNKNVGVPGFLAKGTFKFLDSMRIGKDWLGKAMGIKSIDSLEKTLTEDQKKQMMQEQASAMEEGRQWFLERDRDNGTRKWKEKQGIIKSILGDHDVFDENLFGLDYVKVSLVYEVAKLLDPTGRLSDEDFERAMQATGLKDDIFTSPEQLLQRVDRLEEAAYKRMGSAREDLTMAGETSNIGSWVKRVMDGGPELQNIGFSVGDPRFKRALVNQAFREKRLDIYNEDELYKQLAGNINLNLPSDQVAEGFIQYFKPKRDEDKAMSQIKNVPSFIDKNGEVNDLGLMVWEEWGRMGKFKLRD